MKRDKIIEILEKYGIDDHGCEQELADEIMALPCEQCKAYKELVECYKQLHNYAFKTDKDLSEAIESSARLKRIRKRIAELKQLINDK